MQQDIKEGRTTIVGGEAGTPANSGQHFLLVAEGEIDNDAAEEFRPERELAFAVFRQAFIDIGVAVERGGRGVANDVERRRAELFLFDPKWRGMRNFWLAWLGKTEDDLWALLGKQTHQGAENRVLAALEGRFPACFRGGRRTLVIGAKDVRGPFRGLEADFYYVDEAT